MGNQDDQAQAIARHMLSQEEVACVWGHIYEGRVVAIFQGLSRTLRGRILEEEI